MFYLKIPKFLTILLSLIVGAANDKSAHLSRTQQYLQPMMQIFFLAILIWAVQLKALPSNISHGHADGELTQNPVLAARTPGLTQPWKSKQPYRTLYDGAALLCEHDNVHWTNGRYPPQVQHCKELRDQIAEYQGIWFIGDWEDTWRFGKRTVIAERMCHF